MIIYIYIYTLLRSQSREAGLPVLALYVEDAADLGAT